jgi:hypothetical protein
VNTSDMPATRIPPDFPDTLRRLNYLVDALGLSTYLEIGLGNGGTFDGVNAPYKTGVDPHPWNPAVGHLKGVHVVTSDEYFSRHWSDGIRFDLILLDGLHTAEQTYRDFVNSLHYAHARTIWLIDDVMPNDVFSAIPDQSEALRKRKAATGSSDSAWHGDVYKVVWMIKAFHNNMTVRTFWKQQPQSLVYYSCATDTPSVSSATLGEIASLTFNGTLSHRTEYNIGDEDDILRECVAAMKERAT